MLKKFQKFIMRGNVLQLAIGVMMAAALNDVVSSLTSSFLEPLIQLVVGRNSVEGLVFQVPGTQVVFPYGNFIQAVINFFLTAIVLFLVLQSVSRIEEKTGIAKEEEAAAKKPTPEELYLKEIRDLLLEERKGASPKEKQID